MIDESQRDRFALSLVPGIGPRTLAALIDHFGNATAALKAPACDLQEVPHIGPKVARQIRDAIDRLDVNAEFARMETYGVQLLADGTPQYPSMLTSLAGRPGFLYIRGELQERDRNAVAIVGSRHCSAYGRRIADRLAFDLARAGFTIISGLARGIDGAAHQGALRAGGRTIAVVANGLARIYPPEHADLALQVQANGAILSEAQMQMEPLPGMFPPRNRIISGMSRAVVLVEAAEKSGALITATHAAEQGREVFAVPGPVDSPTSAGTLRLLRHGVRLIRNAQDIIEDLDGIAPIIPEKANAGSMPPDDLDEGQRGIWDYLEEPRSVDHIAQKFSLSIAQLSRVLMVLELKKVIRRLPGNVYERYR